MDIAKISKQRRKITVISVTVNSSTHVMFTVTRVSYLR